MLKKPCLLRRPVGEVAKHRRLRIICYDNARIERRTQWARLAAKIEREMRMLQSLGKLFQAPTWRLTSPKHHEIGWVGPIFAQGEYGPDIVDDQFFAPGRETAVLALRRHLRRVIVEEQTPGPDLAETEPIAARKRRMGSLVGPIKTETGRDEPEDRRFAGSVKASALFPHRDTAHGAERRMKQEDEVVAHRPHHLVAAAMASVSVPSPPTFIV